MQLHFIDKRKSMEPREQQQQQQQNKSIKKHKSSNELWIEKAKTRENGGRGLPNIESGKKLQENKYTVIYRITGDITVLPYKHGALETLRRVCSVSLMYMFLAVCERQRP